jgi:hypothetical protein
MPNTTYFRITWKQLQQIKIAIFLQSVREIQNLPDRYPFPLMLNKPYQPTVADMLAITKLNMHIKLFPYRNFHKLT